MSIRTTTAALQQRPRSLTLFHTIVLTLFGALLLSGQAHATKCPNLVIVLDRSGSMTAAPDGSFANPPNRRWDIAVAAVKKVTKEYNNLLPIGLSMFAPDGGCGGSDAGHEIAARCGSSGFGHGGFLSERVRRCRDRGSGCDRRDRDKREPRRPSRRISTE